MIKRLFENREKKYCNLFRDFLSMNQAKLISFKYYNKAFGNINLVFEYKERVYECISDRDEIWINGKHICDGSYHEPPNDDTKDQMMKIIEQVIFRKTK